MENKMTRFLTVFMSLLLIVSPVSAQEQKDVLKRKIRYGFDINRRPPVNFNMYVSYSGKDWNPSIYVGISIQNDVLQFARGETAFTAGYQVTVAVRTKDNEQTLLTETWTESVEETDFDVTNSRKAFQYTSYRLSDIYPRGEKVIAPGDYECLLEVRDQVSKKSYRNKRPFTIAAVPDSTGPVLPSELTFLYAGEDGEGPLPVVASASVLEFNKPSRAYFRFPVAPEDSLLLNIRIYREEGEANQLFKQAYEKIKPGSGDLGYSYDLPYRDLSEGRYKIRFSGSNKQGTFDREKEFSVVWFDKPVYLYKSDLAVRPLQYLLSEEEYKKARSRNYDDLTDWLKSYWKAKDPTENTVYNELMYEFYSRVDEANREFSTRFKEGWETDQGKVLILYGPPEKVENKRYAVNSVPYIIWSYDDGDVTFTFTDTDQDGEFKLQSTESGKE